MTSECHYEALNSLLFFIIVIVLGLAHTKQALLLLSYSSSPLSLNF